MFRIGVDVGGTFTDFTILDERNDAIRFFKVPSTPKDPSQAIEDGLRQIIATFSIDPAAIGYLGHGTTVATNIVIERRGARTGLLTTRGFRDVLELGRQARPSIYDYRIQKPPVLVPRERRVEVTERVGPDGTVLTPLDEKSLTEAVEALRAANVESVAICFLHSYRRADHEQAAKRAVEKLMPKAYVSVSSEILPEFREFKRVSTTVVNAFVGPRMGNYLERFQARVRSVGIDVQPYTIHSNGGLMSIETVRACPVRSCVSGPAAGVVGAAEIGRVSGFPDLITFDVGGTSTDVSLIRDSNPSYTANRLVAGYPVKTPMIDIHVIGAGGGSIARIDDAGAMKVGPVGGRMTIDLDAAKRAIHDTIAKPLGLSIEAAAHGIVQIANANMSRAIRSVSIEKGYDLSEFALCAFGGAGPLHAAEVAVECGIPRALIPREPGTLCARGMLLTDLSSDYVRSHFCDASPENWRAVLALFDAMIADGNAWLAREAIAEPRRRFKRVLDARYRGQNFEVKVGCDGLGADALHTLVERFHAAHLLAYGYSIPGREIEFVSARIQAIGEVPKAPQAKVAGGTTLVAAAIGARKVYIDARHGWQEAPVYQREKLPISIDIMGPAIVNEMSATTLILSGQTARVDLWGNIVLQVAP